MKYLAIEAVRLLRAARARITPREWWCQGSFARTAGGESTSLFGECADRVCGVGSLILTIPDRARLQSYLLGLLQPEKTVLAVINDAKPAAKAHRNVLAAYDAAIAKLCRTWAIPLLLIALALPAHAQTTTIVGGHNGDGESAVYARLNPRGMARDAQGGIYVVDTNGQRIRKVDAAGVIWTVAGSGVSGFAGDGGSAKMAKLNYPTDVVVDGAGHLYIADQLNNRIRRVDALSGVITTVAGSGVAGFNGDNQPALTAQLNFPNGVDVLADGSVLIADSGNRRVRRVSGGTITTIAGTGSMGYNGDGIPATTATLTSPVDLVHDAAGNVYLSDQGSCRVRRIDPGGTIFMVAGSGGCSYGGDGQDARTATLNGPGAIALDAARGALYIAENNAPRVRVVNLATQVITRFAGTGVPGDSAGDDGPALDARFRAMSGLCVDGASVLIADGGNSGNNNVRAVAIAAVPVATITILATPTRTSTPIPATATRTATAVATSTPTLPLCGPAASPTVPCRQG